MYKTNSDTVRISKKDLILITFEPDAEIKVVKIYLFKPADRTILDTIVNKFYI